MDNRIPSPRWHWVHIPCVRYQICSNKILRVTRQNYFSNKHRPILSVHLEAHSLWAWCAGPTDASKVQAVSTQVHPQYFSSVWKTECNLGMLGACLSPLQWWKLQLNYRFMASSAFGSCYLPRIIIYLWLITFIFAAPARKTKITN